MSTYAIHITGQVQGVGFRPFVYRLAMQYALDGWVSNRPDGVHLTVTGHEEQVQVFYTMLKVKAPAQARIQQASIKQVDDTEFNGFRIVKEQVATMPSLSFTPDLALCADCRKELKNSHNRRFGYAFITCTACGPRYSIMSGLPYDREHTSLASFRMCTACTQEYNTTEDRRYYSQTNSCPACPILLALYDKQQQLITNDQKESIATTVALLAAGKIIAVKGIGGYLLLADATNPKPIQKLRERKKRPTKPFALMYPSLEIAKQDVELKEDEEKLLFSSAAPIVLAHKKQQTMSGVQTDLVAPNLNRLGVMLPYAPLFELLLARFRKPLIATSANSHGNHIVHQDNCAFGLVSKIADFILLHNREILVPQDDSVIQLTSKHQQRIMLRRSRGFAPTVHTKLGEHKNLLAMGADLKSTFAFSHQGNTYVSQYLGDLGEYSNERNFDKCLQHLTSLLDFKPSLILTDQHPAYTSVRLGKALQQSYKVPLVKVQHHEAHFAAVFSENQLLDRPDPVLGVIWDGTGWGQDNLIRGGEFLQFQHQEIATVAQLRPYPHLAGDKMAKEPRLSALSLCHGLESADKLLKPYFTLEEWKLYQSIIKKQKYKLQTTSMGRVFDAAAAILGLCQPNSYEGEAALQLETLATKTSEVYTMQGYTLDNTGGKHVAIKGILNQMLQDLQHGVSKSRIAAKFHVTLVDVIRFVASQQAINKIAFSGGVFQNSLLVDLIAEKMSADFDLYFHKELPPNDECISYGQLAWMHLKYKKTEADRKQNHTSLATIKL